MKYAFQVNGRPVEIEADSHFPLLWALRDNLKLTGTKFGCGIGECAICLVDIDGKPTHSCITPVSRVVGKKVTTIEGLSQDGKRTAVQQAWIDEQVPQCGWCQSGQIIQATALLRTIPKPTDEDIDKAMFPVYCRCGTYPRIRAAIKRASGQDTGSNRPPLSATKNGSVDGLKRGDKAPAGVLANGLRFGTFYKAPGRTAGILTAAPAAQMTGSPTAEQKAGAYTPNCYITITRDGTTVIESSHSEQGQGILTGVMATLVDEADADWDRVKVYMASLGSETPYLMHSITGGFVWLDDFSYLRHAGATVRTMMKSAAAKVWGVPESEIITKKGVASHAKSGKTTTYEELLPVARDLPVPSEVPLKTPDQFQLIGKWYPRVDIPEKVDGSAIFPMDIHLPGMLVGVPVIGRTYNSKSWWYDDSATLRVPGVKQVIKTPTFGEGYIEALIVLADNFYSAYLGAQLLRVDWNDYPANQLTTEDIMGKIRALADQPGKRLLRNDGDVAKGFADADRVVERYFESPFVTHIPMAPMNAVAWAHDGKIEVWEGGMCAPVGAFGDIILELQLMEHPQELIFHQVYGGGNFGRETDWDHVIRAAYLTVKSGAPVKLIYDRVTDTRANLYEGAVGVWMKVGLDKAGKPIAWQIHKVLNDEARRPAMAGLVGAFKTTPTGFPYNPFPFLPMIESFAYPTPSFQVTHTDPMFDVPVGAMRGVGAKDGTFSTERMIDDLADVAGIDPLTYRKSLITDKRLLAVLDDVATRGQWGRTLPPRTGQGLAVCIYDTTRIACLAEATVSEDGKITVNRITTAIDPGIVIDPGSVHSQTEGGAIWGLSNLLHGKIDVVGGGTAQANLDTTHFFRINEAPRVDVAVLSTDNTPGAVGEPGSFIVYGAVGNAVSRASGVKQYRYPFKAVDLIPNPNPS